MRSLCIKIAVAWQRWCDSDDESLDSAEYVHLAELLDLLSNDVAEIFQDALNQESAS